MAVISRPRSDGLRMWIFRISAGTLQENDGPTSPAYSGTGEGRNNLAMANVPNVGPIPPGKYRIGKAYDDEHLGPCVMHLNPLPGTDTFGRDLFRIHGNNPANDASKGCVIVDHAPRLKINASQDRVLEVVA